MDLMRCSHWRRRSAALLCALACAAPVFGQGDPLELQRRAVQRIDAFVDQVRRGADIRAAIPELAVAERELAASNLALAGRADWAALAFGLIKQGHIYRMQSQWPNAIAFYQQAEDAAKRARHVAHQADALAWRALAYTNNRNVAQALADATAAVRLADTVDDKDIQARALDVLASAQVAQGDFAGAAATVNREASVAAQAKDPTAIYFAHLNRGEVYLKTGERCDYRREYEQCFEALDKARVEYQQAVDLVRRLGYSMLVEQTEGIIKNLEARRAMFKANDASMQRLRGAAVFHPKKASDVLVTEKFVLKGGDVPAELVQVYELSKREAQNPLQATAAASRVSDPTNLHTEGLMHEMRGNHDAALSSYLRAVDMLDSDRRRLRDDRSRGSILESRIGVYYSAILQLLERRRYGDAFEITERSRSRALADLLASRQLTVGGGAQQQLFSDSMVLRTKVADAQGRLFELSSSGATPADVSAAQAAVRTLEAQQQTLDARIAAESPRLQSLVNSKPATLQSLQASMRAEGYELLQYLILEHAVLVWHITPDAVTVKNVFLPRDELNAKVAALQKSVSDANENFDETTARELYLYLVQPVIAQVRARHLVIVPHEDLQYVPFQVFQDPADGRFFGERFQITYAPSASVVLSLKKPAPLSGGKLLAVADPGIPAAIDEVAAIAKLFPAPARVVVDALAREADVKAWVRDAEIVHLSVHGKFDGAEPMLSYLSLAPGASDDGRLTAAEMFGLPLDKSRVVVLSACETGRAEATHANEILGMVRALLFAGAGTLVLSHWEVDSAATALWMQTFYQAALTGSIQEAARAALVKVKSTPQYSHPFYWGAFAMVGR
jgi:CHAT domain-containing protein